MIKNLIIVLIFISSPIEVKASEYPSGINNQNYYLFEKGFSCRTNTPGRTVIKTWKNRIQFTDDNEVLIWGNLCSDYPVVTEFDSSEFVFSEDLSNFIYKSDKYILNEHPPKLCAKGQWCPVGESNDREDC